MTDFDYEKAGEFNENYRLVRDLRNDEVIRVGKAFTANMRRVRSLWNLAPHLIGTARYNQHCISIALFKITGIEDLDQLISLDAGTQDLVHQETLRIWKKTEGIWDLHPNPPLRFVAGVKENCRQTSVYSRTDEFVAEGIEAAASAMLIGAWTAFECAAGDLWIVAVNFGPKDWARKIFKAQERAHGIKDKEDSDETKEQEKQIRISQLADYGYDLRHQMGKMLKQEKKVDFSSLNSIKKAYAAIFESDADSLFNEAAHVPLRAIEAVRNLLAHRGGIVDVRFTRIAKSFPEIAGADVGKPLRVTDEMCQKYIEAAARCGEALIRMVDKKMPQTDDYQI